MSISSVALWSDSTYGCLEREKVLDQASELRFPLRSFACSYGGGLVSKGEESHLRFDVADAVVIEMGFNDESAMDPKQAAWKMQKQSWFRALQAAKDVVHASDFHSAA